MFFVFVLCFYLFFIFLNCIFFLFRLAMGHVPNTINDDDELQITFCVEIAYTTISTMKIITMK